MAHGPQSTGSKSLAAAFTETKSNVCYFKKIYKGCPFFCSLGKTHTQTLGTKCSADRTKLFSAWEERPGPPQRVGLCLEEAKQLPLALFYT